MLGQPIELVFDPVEAGLVPFGASARPWRYMFSVSQPRIAETAMVGPRLPSPEKVSVVRGEKVFNEYCAVCHGLYGKGDGPRYAFFAEDQYIPDLSVADFIQGRDEELLQGIREGLRRMDEPLIVMPQFKYILPDNDIESALAFVKTLPKHPNVRQNNRSRARPERGHD
ncbi:MAG: c-type cytochrome [Rhodoplanes sp.]|jgi:mono/diheme cytochrome c family protein